MTWVLTASFISSAVYTPIVGRLSDLFGHRRVLVATLVVVLVGSIICATTTDFAFFIIARVLSGPASSLYALASSTLQHHLPARQMNRATALMSSCLGVGGGFALLIAGAFGGGDYRVIFWFPVACAVLALVAVLIAVPPARQRRHGTVDVLGGFLLSAGLVLVLLPLSQAARWGLGSARSLGCIVAAVVVLAAFAVVERRMSSPMLPLRLLHRPMIVATAIAVLVGAMTFVPLVILPILLQVDPPLVGSGPASPLVIAFLYLFPGTIIGLVGTPVGSRLIQRVGPRGALTAVGITGVVGASLVCALPVTEWALIVGPAVTSIALYVYYGALPLQIVSIVDRGDLGMANSLISLGRWVGAAVATASTSLVLTTSGPGDALTRDNFRTAFVIGLVVSIGIAAIGLVFLRGRGEDMSLAGPGVNGRPVPLKALPPPIGDLTTDIVVRDNSTANVGEGVDHD